MNIGLYLVEKEKRFAKSAARLRDPRVFDFNYLPDEPLMRQELRPVIDALVRCEKTGIANHMLIVGSRGCGKTVSMRYLQHLFKQRSLQILYANCRTHNTSYKILAALLGVRARGVSFAELAEQFAGQYPEDTVVVLDEIDLLSEKDKNKDILDFLSRSQRNYMAVLLSNSPKWASGLDASIQSTLQPELIYFRPYTHSELSEILGQRASLRVIHTPQAIVDKIAQIAARGITAQGSYLGS